LLPAPLPTSNDLRQGGTWTRRQRLKNDLIYLAVRIALAFALLLPRPLLRAACRLLVLLAALALPRARVRAHARLEAGLGAPVPKSRLRAVYRTLADALADTLFLFHPHEKPSRSLSLDPTSADLFRAALAQGRGVVFITAHLGPWERMAALLAEHGFPVATIARESYDPRLTGLYDRLRAPRGVRSIYRARPGAPAAILRELRLGRAIGFLIDLPARGVRALPIPLFGEATLIPIGPARIALSQRAAVLVGTCEPPKSPTGRATLTITPIPTHDLAPEPTGERALLERISHELDARISRWPDAWLGLFAPPPRLQIPTNEASDLRRAMDSAAP